MPERRTFLAVSVSALLPGQMAEKPVEFLCPMDLDIRQAKPGRCPRCGMKLVAGLPDPIEYPLRLTCAPANPQPGQRVKLRFEILHPKSGQAVPGFELIHERVFHLFLIDETLTHFAHVHPEPRAPGVFELDYVVPAGGMWRALCDFYPAGATPQLTARTILLPGGTLTAPTLRPDTDRALRGENIRAGLRLNPAAPLAGEKTLLQYRIEPRAGIEPYLGAMGHMLAASADLIDLIHTHPFLIDGGLATPPEDAKLIQFNLTFPRPGGYRVWAQFQRDGVVNTIPFNVHVTAL